MDDPNINAYEDSFKPKLTLLEWLNERYKNSLRIAASTKNIEKVGWIEDAQYFEQAIEFVKRVEDLRQQNAALVSALQEVRDMIFNLPSGVDENASEDDLSPQDASAHIGGLIVQRINAALAEEVQGNENGGK